MAIDVEVIRDAIPWDDPDWERLARRATPRDIFAMPQWHRAWWEEFSSGKDLLILRITRDEELIAFIPLYRKLADGESFLRFVGGIDLTDYVGPVYDPDDARDVAEALVDWLQRTDEQWSVFDAHNLPVPAHFGEHLVERADAAGLSFTLEEEETSAVILLPASWDEYLARLPGKERHELRRKIRRAERNHPALTMRSTTPETLERDLETFFEMHRGAEGLKGHFMRREIATFFRRVAYALMPMGILRMDFLESGGVPIASTFGFEFDGIYYLYNSAYEPDFASSSPGVVLCARLIERSIEQGLARFDFLRGPERYKYRFGAQPIPLHNLRITR